MRFAVVGLGAVGAAALYHLARAGHTVVGYEQFEIGHTRGSSHGASRIYRLTYPNPTYTRMMAEALPLWQALQAEAGEPLLTPCGILWIGDETDPELLAIRGALQETGVPYEWLTPEVVRTRFPAFRLEPTERALFQSEGGFLRADACVRALIQLARHHGAQLFENTPCLGWHAEPNGIRLHLPTGQSERFNGVILTVGAWLPKWVPALSAVLTVTRQVYAYFAFRGEPTHFDPERHPVWIEATRHFYGFPNDGQYAGIKVAHHQRGEPHDPDSVARPPDEHDLIPLRHAVARRLPDLSDAVVSAHTCLYTNTPDEQFLIEPADSTARVWFASACSGHGFKFAILNGKRVAEQMLKAVTSSA